MATRFIGMVDLETAELRVSMEDERPQGGRLVGTLVLTNARGRVAFPHYAPAPVHAGDAYAMVNDAAAFATDAPEYASQAEVLEALCQCSLDEIGLWTESDCYP